VILCPPIPGRTGATTGPTPLFFRTTAHCPRWFGNAPSSPGNRGNGELASTFGGTRAGRDDDELAFDVGRVVLFGSYADPNRDPVGDVDLAVELVRRPLPEGESEQDRTRRRLQAAEASGHRFRSFFDELSWPEQEVLNKLRNRSRVLAFVDYREHEDLLGRIPHVVIYEHPSASGRAGPNNG